MTNPWQSPPARSGTGVRPALPPTGLAAPLAQRDTARWFTRADLVVGAVTAAVIALLGAPIGVIWEAISPRIDLPAVSAGSETAFGVEVGADARFFFLTLGVGLVTGALAWRFGRRFGPAVPLGLVAGALSAAVVAAQVGYLVRRPGLTDALRPGISADVISLIDFRLRAVQVLVVWPIAAVAVYLALHANRGARHEKS